jgi:spore germination cell wall hydrolase CwlJ-like protein
MNKVKHSMFGVFLTLLMYCGGVNIYQTNTQVSEPIRVSEKELKCLTDNVYYEAGNQPVEGKLAVAFVTLNRVFANGFPSSICGVVYQRKVYSTCQFSWVCQKPNRFEAKHHEEAKTVAKAVLNGYNGQLKDPTNGALFFHAHYVKPKWRHHFVKTAHIADHIFYRPT